MKIIIKEPLKTICSNENSMHCYFGWPSVARLQDGSLLAASSAFRLSHICPFGKVAAVRSYDEGKTWTSPEVIMDTLLDDRDAGIATFGKSGVIVTSFNNSTSMQRKYAVDSQKEDAYLGRVGNSAYRIAYLDEVDKREDSHKHLGSTAVISNDGGKTFGDVIMLPISSPHGPCELSDGTILYVGRYFDENKDKENHIAVYTMKPDGSYEYRSKIADIADDLLSCEPHAIQTPSGRIVVHIRVQGRGYFTIYQSVSDDMGYTFSEPVQILSQKGGSPAHLINHSSGMLVSVYGYREVPYGIRVMFSKDDGETWDTDNIILDEEETPDLGYPCSVELENGDILTVLYTHEKGKSYAVIRQVIWNFEG